MYNILTCSVIKFVILIFFVEVKVSFRAYYVYSILNKSSMSMSSLTFIIDKNKNSQ